MLNLYMFLSVCLSTTYTVKADYGAFYNGYPQSYWSPPSPLPVNTGWNNNNYWGNFQPLWTPPKQYYPPQNNGFNYNSNYNGFNNYNNGNFVSYGPYEGATVYVQNGELFINGKKIPGYVENQATVIKYGKGILTVNGERKKEFDGIAGTGTIELGTNSDYVDDNDDDDDEDEDEEEDEDENHSYTIPGGSYMGMRGPNVNTNQYGNTYNNQQCPGCTLGRLVADRLKNEITKIVMGHDGIKNDVPSGNFQPLWTPPKPNYPTQKNGMNYNSNNIGFNNYNNGGRPISDSDDGEDENQTYTTPGSYMGMQGPNVNTNQYGNAYNNQQCPGCTLGRMVADRLKNEITKIVMGHDGIKNDVPNGKEMSNKGMKIGGPHGLKTGNQMFSVKV
ncbi:insoluble matrix shell protein 4-like isoform X2 [Adelges cooleyi]|uniref:insoluble matrix shell protein 4-like isoform X1 n=1 Tax=Adelges cooleyi TaxID=133065 RepID=UPI00217F4836|nr:insoluble matrix shell protein 4-like isoform X1 [Adelges cooleyi]XP_050420050.1 insoluble matrix shell protein 4-like isoform X2 [Adelges cooleyi]